MSSPVITIKNLEKTYKTESETLTILKNLNIEINEGSKFVVVGESGSGKSTFLNIVGGLDKATSGSVTVGPYEITSLNEAGISEYRSRYLGLIFQFHYLLKDFTALENVFLPAYMAGVPKKEAMEKARILLNDVGLSDRTDHLPSQLSGGERQRVAVARAIAAAPPVILADETTGNLDTRSTKDVMKILHTLKDEGRTVIVITHDNEIAMEAERVVRIRDGRIVEDYINPGFEEKYGRKAKYDNANPLDLG